MTERYGVFANFICSIHEIVERTTFTDAIEKDGDGVHCTVCSRISTEFQSSSDARSAPALVLDPPIIPRFDSAFTNSRIARPVLVRTVASNVFTASRNILPERYSDRAR